MNTHRSLALLLAVAFLPLTRSHCLAQGSLTPPGVPGPTMKTLDQIEPRTAISALPFTITASGSYYVAGNLTPFPSGGGITVDANNVTLDLGGFELAGNGGSTSGIRITALRSNVVIRNGTVRGWGGSGVAVDAITVARVRVESVRAIANSGHGIAVGIDAVIADCHASGNVLDGINAGDGAHILRSRAEAQNRGGIVAGLKSVVADCAATGNDRDGFSTGNGSVISNSLADGNALLGFFCRNDSVVDRCLATNNTSTGIRLGDGATITNSVAAANSTGIFATGTCSAENLVARGNLGSGIAFSNSSSLKNCSAMGNQGTVGISAGAGSTLTNCHAHSNTSTAVSSAGIAVGARSTLIGCSATGNLNTNATPSASTGTGISAGATCTLRDCVAQANRGDGIRAGNGSVMTGCSADANQGQYGISVGEESIVTHCTARGNTSTMSISAGIHAFQNSSVIGCSASENTSTAGTLTEFTGVGIIAGDGSVIRECQVRQNVGDGIRAWGTDCLVIGNLASANGVPIGNAAGIRITGFNCRVEGNTITGNDRGIDVIQAENFIARNTARGNTTNYEIAAGNSVGTIVQSPNSAAISGLTGGAGVGSTDPWANFSF